MKEVLTLCVQGLSEELIRSFVLADNKFSERAGWDREILVAELEELSLLLPTLDLDLSLTGFEAVEIDMLLGDLGDEKIAPEDRLPPTAGPIVSRRGEMWILGKHCAACGDARDPSVYDRLMQGKRAAAVFTDPPHNAPIRGHAQGRRAIKHPDFTIASGEMDEAEFHRFLKSSPGAAAQVSRAGSPSEIALCFGGLYRLAARP